MIANRISTAVHRFVHGDSPGERPRHWVKQEEGMGCVVACIAMLLGRSYWDARSLFPHFDPCEGLASSDGLRALGEYGWAYSSKYPHYSPERRDRRIWPVDAFAPVHLCTVGSGGYHAVLMLEDGHVWDPLRRLSVHSAFTLRDYPVVHEIHGLWRVR